MPASDEPLPHRIGWRARIEALGMDVAHDLTTAALARSQGLTAVQDDWQDRAIRTLWAADESTLVRLAIESLLPDDVNPHRPPIAYRGRPLAARDLYRMPRRDLVALLCEHSWPEAIAEATTLLDEIRNAEPSQLRPVED